MRNFTKDIAEVKAQVDEFKNKTNTKQAQTYSKEIDEIITRLKYLTQEMEHIHK
jgi:hypothetical protein